MQINYDYGKDRRANANGGFFWLPSYENTLQAMDTPVVYAPYGTPEFWPSEVASLYNPVLNTPDTSIAPSSATGTVAAASALSGLGDYPPPSSPAAAVATGQPLAPITLVTPMPSITPQPQLASDTGPVCANAVDAWVTNNPMLAGLGVLAVYLLLGGRR
jgi:hypothetical protein